MFPLQMDHGAMPKRGITVSVVAPWLLTGAPCWGSLPDPEAPGSQCGLSCDVAIGRCFVEYREPQEGQQLQAGTLFLSVKTSGLASVSSLRDRAMK